MRGDTQLIGNVRRDTKIYRIFKQKYFFSLFKDRTNALVLPKKWEDPFENVILKAEILSESGEKGRFGFHDDVYGQCWTLHTASDAMWRIYSDKQNAVRVRTTVGKLIDALCDVHGEWAQTTCFIGKVEYMGERRLREFARNIFKNGITPEAIACSLLVKRNAYRHEREVRLIYVERDNRSHANGVYKFAINPLGLLDQAMVDPRYPYDKYLRLKKRIVGRSGLSEKQVKRSLLYRPPKGFVVEIP